MHKPYSPSARLWKCTRRLQWDFVSKIECFNLRPFEAPTHKLTFEIKEPIRLVAMNSFHAFSSAAVFVTSKERQKNKFQEQIINIIRIHRVSVKTYEYFLRICSQMLQSLIWGNESPILNLSIIVHR